MSSSSSRRRAAISDASSASASASSSASASASSSDAASASESRSPSADDPMRREVPARYIGEHPVYLKPGQRRYRDGDGAPLKPTRRLNPVTEQYEHIYMLSHGDTLMMSEIEVRGQTLLIDPSGNRPPLWLGAGWCPLPEHERLSAHDGAGLRFLAPDGVYRFYEVHEGRSDFELLDPEAPSSASASADKSADESASE